MLLRHSQRTLQFSPVRAATDKGEKRVAREKLSSLTLLPDGG